MAKRSSAKKHKRTKRRIDLDAPREFFDPRSGTAANTLPSGDVRTVVEDLYDRTLSLRSALERLQKTTTGKLRVLPKEKEIILEVQDGSDVTRLTLLRYI